MSQEYVLQPFRAPLDLRIDYRQALNEQQYAAVTAPPGPALVIAGAGSGKTRTLIYRVAFLLEQGIQPDRILLLTFTNKAAREMMRRVTELLGQELPALWGGTFHAVGYRLLRRHADRVGYRPDFTILDREDAVHLLKTCVAEAEIDTTATRFPKADVLADLFSLAVNTHQRLPELLERHYQYFAALAAPLQDVWQRYQARKQAANVMDFDDLLSLWGRLLHENPELLERYQRQFQFILVDEYQDTNYLQSEVVDLLAARTRNLMVVGDDAQSIYAWRGAEFKNILQFPQRYPEATLFKIERNYRSTPEILAVANGVIAANLRQFAKNLEPTRRSGIKPVLVVCGDANQQAAFVAQQALKLREEGAALNRMAVLYRSHFHALELQLELTRRNIPFAITSGLRFFEQAHIKDVAAYLRLVCNPDDELAFKRLVQLQPGIGGKGAERLWTAFAHAAPVSVGSQPTATQPADPAPDSADAQPAPAPARAATAPILQVRFQACDAWVPKKARSHWPQVVETCAQLAAEPLCREPAKMIRLVLEAGYEAHLQDSYANYRSRLEDLEQMAGFAQQFAGLEEFLAQLSLLSNLEADDDRVRESDDERIRLSTIHQAKGLEFDVVFVIMLCEGLFPLARALEDPDKEEEERRLFYVAITRARNELYLTHPLMRFARGYSGDALQEPSRFLKEIPVELCEEWTLRAFNPYGT